MTIKFADGTHIEIAATAFDDFVKHDLKWAEFVHGRATGKESGLLQRIAAPTGSRSLKPGTQCPSLPGGRLLTQDNSYH